MRCLPCTSMYLPPPPSTWTCISHGSHLWVKSHLHSVSLPAWSSQNCPVGNPPAALPFSWAGSDSGSLFLSRFYLAPSAPLSSATHPLPGTARDHPRKSPSARNQATRTAASSCPRPSRRLKTWIPLNDIHKAEALPLHESSPQTSYHCRFTT